MMLACTGHPVDYSAGYFGFCRISSLSKWLDNGNPAVFFVNLIFHLALKGTKHRYGDTLVGSDTVLQCIPVTVSA
jgi:hypothetical protein